MYQPSRFNVFYDLGSRRCVANTLSHAVVAIDQTHEQALKSGDLADIAQSLPALAAEHIVVPADLDELALIRHAYNRVKYDPEYGKVLLCPTLDCNFRCPYCYETRRKGKMEPQVQDAVVAYVAGMAAAGTKNVEISWYGGEPLLYPDVIERLCPLLKDACHEAGMKVGFSIITNGYLLDEKNVRLLADLGFSHAQITLDGNREQHNSRRCLANGGGTYDTILANIKALAEAGVTCGVRVNIDKTNMGAFEQVKAAVMGLTDHGSIRCYPAVVTEAEGQSAEQRRRCHSHDEYASFYQQVGMRSFVPDGLQGIKPTIGGCGAESCSAVVIDHEGYVYQCWNDVGVREMAHANVVDASFSNPAALVRYLGRDPFTEEECATCAYLPLCLGSCKWEYDHNASHACSQDRYLFDLAIAEQYGDQ